MAKHSITFDLIYSDDVTPERARADIREWARAVSGTASLSPQVHLITVSDVTTEQLCGDYPAPCNCDDPVTHDAY